MLDNFVGWPGFVTSVSTLTKKRKRKMFHVGLVVISLEEQLKLIITFEIQTRFSGSFANHCRIVWSASFYLIGIRLFKVFNCFNCICFFPMTIIPTGNPGFVSLASRQHVFYFCWSQIQLFLRFLSIFPK